MRAYIVVDLGFGDSGKGLLTDFLTRQFGAGVVVRYNGGAQAGHNVVAPDGRHHTFSQFGSGTFIPGVRTYLSKDVVIHPSALLVEGDILRGKGIQDAFSRIRLSEDALVITPFHQAANHIREWSRGENRHGSCGVGVGEAVEDAQSNVAGSVRAGDLSNPARLRRKLRSIRDQKREQLVEWSKDRFSVSKDRFSVSKDRFSVSKDRISGAALAQEWDVFEREDVTDTWIATVARIGELGLVAPDTVLRDWLNSTETVIFEGAQGVLLDADAGFHPYTTWSRCTAANALELLQEMAPGSGVYQIGVMRSYAVRHGPGPLPTETDALMPVISEHNHANPWQGRVRYGWLDSVLARYAMSLTGKLDALAVTHMDVLARLKSWKYCSAYQGHLDFDRSAVDLSLSGGVLVDFRLPRFLPLEQRTQFTQALSAVTPVLETYAPEVEKVIEKIEALLGQPVRMISEGPGADDVRIF